jgi:uncharacterized repeat protein (TIGR02543 family)
MMVKRVLSALLSVLLAGAAAWAEDPVYFADKNLKSAVEEELWVSDPTPTDMLGLTHLNALCRGITGLAGLEYADNLQVLALRENEISDLAPLSGLTNLVTLNLSMNQISDLSPLSGLASLTTLDVHDNPMITDISAVSGMTVLETLIIRFDSVSDISALAGLSNLRYADLWENYISDISPLSGLTSLSYLDLRYNPLNQEACNTYIPQILANNPGVNVAHTECTDVHRPRQILISSTAGGSVTIPGEGRFTYERETILRLTALADPGYVFAGWSGSYSSPQNPVFITLTEDLEIRAHFTSVLDELYVDGNTPGDPRPADDQAAHPHEDGTADYPFDHIQEAIEVAREGATILVRPGTYRENIDFLRKNVRVIGRDPNDPTQSSWPVLEGTGNGPVVLIGGGQRPQCLLTGFVITRGQGQPAGAIHCEDASPTIAHCLIVGNRATDPDGATVYCEDSQAVLTNCTMADNYAGPNGAGLTLIDSDVTVLDSILWDNLPNEIRAGGTSVPDIRYCTVRGWWPDWGDIHKNPLFARAGSWVNPNDPNEILGSANSRAVWVEGDYHLQSEAGRWDPQTQSWVLDKVTSPALDAGLAASPVGHEPTPNGGRINMGVYGGTAEAGKSHSLVISQ